MPTASSLAWKTSLRKSQDAVALQQIKERGALPMIDRGDIRQVIDRCSNIWLHCRALVMVVWSIRLTAWLQNSKKRRNGQRDWCMSRVTAIISALVICIIVCLSWAVNHYRDKRHYLQSPAKAWRIWGFAERGNYWHADASAWCCCARCKIHEGVRLMLKLKMMLCVMMLPLVVVGCTSKQSAVSVATTLPPAWIMQPPSTGRYRWTGLFHPQREADHYAKTTGRNQKYINEQCR